VDQKGQCLFRTILQMQESVVVIAKALFGE